MVLFILFSFEASFETYNLLIMKRKLPQWLLDATNNNDKNVNTKSPSIRKTRKPPNRNDNCNIENDRSEHVSSPREGETDLVTNGTINIVPISKLLSPSRNGVPKIDSNIHISDTGVEMNDQIQGTHSSLVTSTNELQTVIKTEKIDEVEPSTSNLNGTSANDQPVVIKQEIKDEPADQTADTATSVPSINVKVESVVVKPERRSCNFGIKCFR